MLIPLIRKYNGSEEVTKVLVNSLKKKIKRPRIIIKPIKY